MLEYIRSQCANTQAANEWFNEFTNIEKSDKDNQTPMLCNHPEIKMNNWNKFTCSSEWG